MAQLHNSDDDEVTLPSSVAPDRSSVFDGEPVQRATTPVLVLVVYTVAILAGCFALTRC